MITQINEFIMKSHAKLFSDIFSIKVYEDNNLDVVNAMRTDEVNYLKINTSTTESTATDNPIALIDTNLVMVYNRSIINVDRDTSVPGLLSSAGYIRTIDYDDSNLPVYSKRVIPIRYNISVAVLVRNVTTSDIFEILFLENINQTYPITVEINEESFEEPVKLTYQLKFSELSGKMSPKETGGMIQLTYNIDVTGYALSPILMKNYMLGKLLIDIYDNLPDENPKYIQSKPIDRHGQLLENKPYKVPSS